MQIRCYMPKALEWPIHVKLINLRHKSLSKYLIHVLSTLPDHKSVEGLKHYQSKRDQVGKWVQYCAIQRSTSGVKAYTITIKDRTHQQAISQISKLLHINEGQFLSYLIEHFAKDTLKEVSETQNVPRGTFFSRCTQWLVSILS